MAQSLRFFEMTGKVFQRIGIGSRRFQSTRRELRNVSSRGLQLPMGAERRTGRVSVLNATASPRNPPLILPFCCSASPFALKGSRSAGIAWGIVFGLGAAHFYRLVFSMTLSLGRLQVFPPWLPAWSANILLLMLGSYLFLRVRQ